MNYKQMAILNENGEKLKEGKEMFNIYRFENIGIILMFKV